VIAWPRVGLGTAATGGLFEAVDDDEALATVERAWARGVRLFDTAPDPGQPFGARSPAELDESLDALAAPVPAELWTELP
jgi:aryl-alcohol dehydrogenase-like predicted oxidoreductase